MEIRREAINLAIIVSLFLSVSFMSERAYPANAEFLSAQKAKWALFSGSGDAFQSITAWAYEMLGGGRGAFSPEGMVEFLSLLSVALGIIGIASFYFALRNYGFSENPSLFAGALFATAPAALFAFMPKYYSEYTLALSFCAMGLLLFSLGGKNRAFVAASFGFFVLSSFVSPAFSLFGIGFALALAAEAGKKYARERNLGAFALPAVLLAPSILIAFSANLFFSAPSFNNSIFDLKFVLPLAALCLAGIARKFEKEGDAFFAAMFCLGILASFANSYAALPMLAFCAAAGMNWLFSDEKKEKNERAAAYLAFFFFLPFSFAGFSDPVYSLVLSITFAVLIGALLYVYKFNVKWLPVAAACFLVLSSVAGGIVLGGASANGAAPNSGGRDLGSISRGEYEAYLWLGENTPPGARIATVWDGTAAGFLSGREVEAQNRDFVKFLAGNGSTEGLKGEEFDYAVVSSGVFDYAQRFRDLSGTSFRVESFSFYANITTDSGNAVLFRSSSGALLMRPIGSNGKFAISDAGYFDAGGAQIGVVPYSSIIPLDSKTGPDSPENRQVWVQGIYSTNAFEAFFGQIGGLEKVYENAQVRVFRVE